MQCYDKVQINQKSFFCFFWLLCWKISLRHWKLIPRLHTAAVESVYSLLLDKSEVLGNTWHTQEGHVMIWTTMTFAAHVYPHSPVITSVWNSTEKLLTWLCGQNHGVESSRRVFPFKSNVLIRHFLSSVERTLKPVMRPSSSSACWENKLWLDCDCQRGWVSIQSKISISKDLYVLYTIGCWNKSLWGKCQNGFKIDFF